MPPALAIDLIEQHLTTKTIGQRLVYIAQTGSTNDDLKVLAAQGVDEGAVVLTDFQTAGKGRQQRSWLAPPGSSLLSSLLLRPHFLPPAQSQQLTMLCALAMRAAIAAETGLSVGLKWPNDFQLQGRKLGGVLTEQSFSGATLDWVVVGLGLNVAQDFSQVSLSLNETAISLQMALSRRVSREAILVAYLQAVEERYDQLQAGHSPRAEWAAALDTLGREVVVHLPDGSRLQGRAEDVADDGALLLRTGNQVHCLAVGEISLRSVEPPHG